ncbi:post-GPI attachment to proteins factor 2-like isoform X1 [Halyomorpha halys]|uniref:post-GPI attachment to proteins factor 2-like isoform X1 n=1 Tax=Halyomorpha halys TaxID=286706 RepID=UPI0006D50C23|nr:post-GPI attachment to proteins factor 2-like isoform X1 [Halyomorpha halys]XP_014294244.1 post-GPI attachment to proteins factor 2-like isoform X1 [Halyomorpha halys]
MDIDHSPLPKHSNKNVYFLLSFRKLCIFTVSLPLFTLIVCFIFAYIFQQNEIHETHCRVYNIIPSISAITGISPERYLWRISIALHLGPRFLISEVYNNYYSKLIGDISPISEQIRYLKFVRISYWLSLTEILSLVGVTYISNQDNYPLHEKIFIIFMISSLVYMLISLKIFQRTHPVMTKSQFRSYSIKKVLFLLSMICTLGLVIFFMKHRLFCHDLAFSWFALCEYIIASANMGYHITVFLDFPSEHIIITQPDCLSKVTKTN